jgi:hypothetical protein
MKTATKHIMKTDYIRNLAFKANSQMISGRLIKAITLFVVVVSLVFPVSVFAAAQGTGPQQDSGAPSIEILSSTPEAIDLLVRFSANPLIQADPENPGAPVFDETLYDHPSEAGVPDLPVLNEEIEVPANEGLSLEILDSQSYSAVLGEDNLPSSIPNRAEDVEKCADNEVCSIDEPSSNHQTEGIYPSSAVAFVNSYIVRGHQIAQFQFSPVQYDITQGTVEIFQEITFRILLAGAGTRAVTDNPTAYTSTAFENLLSSTILNYNEPVLVESDRAVGGEGYLIIVPDAFISSLSSLVDLKENQGFSVTVAGLSATGTTANDIKAYIQYAYDNWSVPPTYVLLIGDVDNGTNTIPAFTGTSSNTATDLYYGTVDGADWVPDIFIGRLPARTTAQLATMISNLNAYNNLTGSESWVKKAAFLASNDSSYWDFAEATQNYVVSTYTQSKGYTGTYPSNPQAGGDKLYAYTYSAGTANVTSSVNNSRALIAYSGHGSTISWGGPSFGQTNIRNISSTGAFSVVTSFACLTGNYAVTESFGETWMLQSNKGAIAFIGSSANSYWTPDDMMERAMINSLYSGTDSANVVGSFTYAGLMAIENNRPGTGTAQSLYYWESYNILGDPSLEMLLGPKSSDFTLTANPSTITVCQSENTSTTISVGQTIGFSTPVSLSLSDVPTGITPNFSVNPVTPPNSSQLNLSAASDAPTGEYTLLLSGDAGSLHHEFNLGLSIFNGSPEVITLSSPANGATSVATDASLSWLPGFAGQTYDLQVALDSNFSQIVYNKTGLSQSSFTPSSEWTTNTTYFWRVRANNPCGTSAYSTTYQFKTALGAGECPDGTTSTNLYSTDFSSTTGWVHTGTNDTWTQSSNRYTSPSYAFYSVDKNEISVQHLVSPTISIPETFGEPVRLKFWHWFNMESNTTGCFDGAFLEISTNGGQTWSQIPDSLLLTTGYKGTISSSYGNPIGGSQGWCGVQDWSEAVVDLTTYAGQNVKLRFTQGSDASLGLEGWYVDDFSMVACEAKPDYRPYISTTNITVGQTPGQEIVVRLELTNAGLNPDSYALDLTSSLWVSGMLTRDAIELQPGETTVVEINVNIPADASFGDVEHLLLSVTSMNDPENPPAQDIVSIDLMAALMSYIPVISN